MMANHLLRWRIELRDINKRLCEHFCQTELVGATLHDAGEKIGKNPGY